MAVQGAAGLSLQSGETTQELGPERFSPKQQAQIAQELETALADAPSRFGSRSEAALYAHDRLGPISNNYDIEVGTYVTRYSDGFGLGKPLTSFHNFTIENMPRLLGTSDFHVHPLSSKETGFSGNDISRAERNRSPSFVSQRGSLIRYRANELPTSWGPGDTRANYVDIYNASKQAWQPAKATVRY
ncbi:MAG: hypothetical protein GXP16_01780 [Gammaproteobacteria bacterium]|nr:hypothetical protein [Gammaproteobacteria bacterium]